MSLMSIRNSSGIRFISPPTLKSSGGCETFLGCGGSFSFFGALLIGRMESVFALWSKLLFSGKLFIGFPEVDVGAAAPVVSEEAACWEASCFSSWDEEEDLLFAELLIFPNFFFNDTHLELDWEPFKEDSEPDLSRESREKVNSYLVNFKRKMNIPTYTGFKSKIYL